MRALIFVEHSNGIVSDSALEMAQLAKSAGAECHGLICAGDSATAESIAAQLTGFDGAVSVTDKAVETYNPDAVLIALKAATDAQTPDLVMTSYSTAGVDLASALATQADRPMLGYVTALDPEGDGLVATSQVYGGKLVATTTVPLPAVIAVMPGAAKTEDATGAAPAVTTLRWILPPAAPGCAKLLPPIHQA